LTLHTLDWPTDRPTVVGDSDKEASWREKAETTKGGAAEAEARVLTVVEVEKATETEAATLERMITITTEIVGGEETTIDGPGPGRIVPGAEEAEMRETGGTSTSTSVILTAGEDRTAGAQAPVVVEDTTTEVEEAEAEVEALPLITVIVVSRQKDLLREAPNHSRGKQRPWLLRLKASFSRPRGLTRSRRR
jgi:hypothetical protein